MNTLFNKLVEISKEVSETDKKPINFRAKLLGLIYEELLDEWLKRRGYNVVKGDYRKGKYKGNKTAVDFIVRKNNRTYVAEAKCWPAYQEGRLKTLSISTIRRAKEEVGNFMNKDFVNFYECEFGKLTDKILFWWDFNKEDKKFLLKELGLSDIVSIRKIMEELKGSRTIRKYKNWTNELFKGLGQENQRPRIEK